MGTIFHIADGAEWEAAKRTGEYRVSTLGKSLEEVGFVHCSTAEQVDGVAALFYRGRPGLVLLVIDVDKVRPEIRYESADAGGPEFPHIYGPLNVDAVVEARPFEAPA